MCGIAGIFNIKIQSRELRNKALRMARKIRHRGPFHSRSAKRRTASLFVRPEASTGG